MPAISASLGLKSASSPMMTYITTIIGFLVFPGIFLLLLFLGKSKAKRGTAFGIVWAIISGLSLISNIASAFTKSTSTDMLKDFAKQLVPGGTAVYFALPILGAACMLISCIIFLISFKKPENFENGLN